MQITSWLFWWCIYDLIAPLEEIKELFTWLAEWVPFVQWWSKWSSSVLFNVHTALCDMTVYFTHWGLAGITFNKPLGQSCFMLFHQHKADRPNNTCQQWLVSLSPHYRRPSFVNILLVSFGSNQCVPQKSVDVSVPWLNSCNLCYNNRFDVLSYHISTLLMLEDCSLHCCYGNGHTLVANWFYGALSSVESYTPWGEQDINDLLQGFTSKNKHRRKDK